MVIKKQTLKEATELLEDLRWPTRRPGQNSRKNIADNAKPIQAFVLGKTKSYYKPKPVDSAVSKQARMKPIKAALKKIMHEHDPNFKYTSIQLNRNVATKPHTDRNNKGLSKTIALGRHTGGGVVIEDKPGKTKTLDTNQRMVTFDGTKRHHSAKHRGDRIVAIYYTQ